MPSDYTIKTIAHIHSEFPDKFGIPRQSGLVADLRARILFEPEYQIAEAFKGLEDFSHIWLIWGFSENLRNSWSPSVRPPRLGGNIRMGVFATRAPFRPNPLGLSCVKLEAIEFHPVHGPVLHVSGADLMDGTPIFLIRIPDHQICIAARKNGSIKFRNLYVKSFLPCSPRIRGHPIKMIRSASMACGFPVWKSNSESMIPG